MWSRRKSIGRGGPVGCHSPHVERPHFSAPAADAAHVIAVRREALSPKYVSHGPEAGLVLRGRQAFTAVRVRVTNTRRRGMN